jgi:acetoin utilization deacetylase AcuC-like enzyme
MATLVINELYDDSGHEDPGHPERPERVTAAMAGVDDLHLGDDLVIVPVRAATRVELVRAHDGAYLDELGAFCYGGGGDIDPDTYATYDSWLIAKHAAGAGLAVIQELQRRKYGVGFVAVRPPGHHALKDRAMGFCLLNNVAVAAATLVGQGQRVLIVDWDVHHGNGTQAIFWDNPDVLYVSTHQWPLFPGSGTASEVGGWHAIGQTVNIPLPPGATGDVLRRGIEEIATPVIEEFAPTWVLVSAGFDAHRADPMANLELTSGDFALLANTVAGFAPKPGRLVMFLEGGYDLDAIRASVHAALGSVLGSNGASEPASSGGPGGEVVTRTQGERSAALSMMHTASEGEVEP